MTPRQKDVYDCIVKFWKKNGHGPSFTEIVEHTESMNSRSNAYRHVRALHALGMIYYVPGRARSARPLDVGVPPLSEPNSKRKPRKKKKSKDEPWNND